MLKWFNKRFISKKRVQQVISEEIDSLEFTLLLAQNVDFAHVDDIEKFHKQLSEYPVRIETLEKIREGLK